MKLLKMYINKANKLNKSDRFIVVQRWNNGWKVIQIAKRFNVSTKTIYNILNRFKLEGVFGLQDRKPGILRTPLNPHFYANIVLLRKNNGWGACRIEKHFKKKGFLVSHNKINQVIAYEKLTRKKLGKRERPKYVRYQVDNCNDQWNIDWSIDPVSKKYLFAILDDRSRFIVFAGLFNSASAENSAIGLEKAINTYGAPKEIVSDNGSHFKTPHSERISGVKEVVKPLRLVEEKYVIKHIFIRAYHPQSNGKIERWFGSYKGELPLMGREDLYDCMTYVHFYNFERIHQSLDYDTPAEIYLGCEPNSG
jgi:transposase InsO family protein